MDILNKIKTKLDKYPNLSYEIDENSIMILPWTKSGFSVWLKVSEESVTVGFDGWHEEFESEEAALNCLAFGLSDECRLKVIRYGDTDCSWILESKENGKWIEDSKTGLIVTPFWKKKSIEYRQNNQII